VHDGLARVAISGGGLPPLLLLLADSDTASTFWRVDTDRGPLLVRGAYLVRSARWTGAVLSIDGDTEAPGDLEVFDRRPRVVRWNDRQVATDTTASGSLLGALDGPRPAELPALDAWKHHEEAPETQPGFDDAGWTIADHTTTANPTKPATLPVLYTDDYGFHYGDVWYRGHFTATGGETELRLTAGTGRNGAWQVWVNGTHLGTVRTGNATGNQNSSGAFALPPGLLRAGQDNVISVLVRDMGHNEDGGKNDAQKAPRGLLSAQLDGSDAPVTWRIQGARGGETLADEVRGPQNNGGLFGERNGWSLPGFPDGGWETVTLPHAETAPGIAWYRTKVRVQLPNDQDIPVGLRFTDDPGRHYRVLIFVNGWNLGQYVNDVGPQHVFVLPEGILRHRGENTIALAVWSDDAASGGLGQVSLEALGNTATSLRVRDVPSPG
jgi:beta-galactosidase GanA